MEKTVDFFITTVGNYKDNVEKGLFIRPPLGVSSLINS